MPGRHWPALLAAEHPLGRGLAPRDQLLGWDERTRRHNIARLVSNDRFLIREGVRVKNLEGTLRDGSGGGGDLCRPAAQGHLLQGRRL